MTAKGFTLEIDRDDMDRYLADGKTAIAQLVDELASELESRIGEESASASARVAASWEVEPGPSADERRVVSDVFFAAFLARGTKGHDAATASVMQFTVDGNFVRASFVAGIPANPFHERAIAATEAAADGIIEQLIAGIA
jgi:hypothetical protein